MKSKKLFSSFGLEIILPGTKVAEVSPDQFGPLLDKYGAILFKELSFSTSDLVTLSHKFSHDYLKHGATDVRKVYKEESTIAEVLTGSDDVWLHGEMFYLPYRPNILWLNCLIPSTQGGATTVCDAHLLYKKLPLELLNKFRANKLLYRHSWPQDGWINIFGTDNKNEVLERLTKTEGISNIDFSTKKLIFDFVTPAIITQRDKPCFLNSVLNIIQYSHIGIIEVLFENGQSIPQSDIDVIMNISNQITEEIKWRKGDVIMIDNYRMMHGRKSFSGERKILTRFSS